MVAIKNVVFAASCVASALAAPATKRQDWGQGGQVGGWDQSQGQTGGDAGAWDQSQGQGQAAGSADVPSVPIAEDGQSAGTSTDASAGASASVPSVPIAGDGQSSGAATGAATDASAGNSTDAAASSDSAAVDASAGGATSAVADVDGTTYTTSSSGQEGDYYYSHWVENNSGATMKVGGGAYSLEWTEASGNVVSGIGWNPASAK